MLPVLRNAIDIRILLEHVKMLMVRRSARNIRFLTEGDLHTLPP